MKFFIVDDSEPVVLMLQALLESAGHEVQSELDSRRGLERIRAARPDCVLLDIMMPELDGFTLLKQLREAPDLAGLKVVMVSSKPYEHDRNRAMQLGANGFVNKVAEKDRLLPRILEIVEDRVKLRFWGVRGTLPVPGPRSLRYGGNTNCVTLEFPSQLLFVFDAGTGIKVLGDWLLAEKRSPMQARIFISHPHWDHINALPFFAPLYVRGNKFELIGCSHAGITMQEMISAQMDGIYFPVTVKEFAADVRYREVNEGRFEVDGIAIEAMLLKHPGHCLGYRVRYNGRSICYVSDNELYPHFTPYHDSLYRARLVEFVAGAQVLITDTTYTDAEYPSKLHYGHSPVSEVVSLAHDAKVQNLYLYHHDPDQTDDMIDAKLAAARKQLESLKSKTRCEAPAEGSSLLI